MIFATTIVLLIVFIVTVYYYYKFSSAVVRKSSRLPGLKPEWFLGNLRNTRVTSGRVLHEVYSAFKEKYGDAFSFWLGPYYSIVLSRVEHAEHVLTDRQTYDMSGHATKTFSILLPNGLIALRGDAWKRHARFMVPMFKRAKVLPNLDTIVTCIDRFIDERLVDRDGQIHTDLVVQCQNVLLNLITLIAFDYDLESPSQDDALNLQQAFNDFVYYGSQFVLVTGIPFWLGKMILAVNWKYQRALRTMKHYVMNIITEEQRRQKDEFNLISSLMSSIKTESSSNKISLNPEEVFDEISLSILAGFETTSTALSWFIFYMSKYPDVQRKIQDELEKNHLSSTTHLTQDLLDSLVYVECVVKELLCCAPIGTAIAREATRDDVIDGIPIKKDDIVVLAVQNLHDDPRYWKIDPTKFIPERFLDLDKNPPQYAYMPFGGSHRACVGQDLAVFELKIASTRLMQRVTFEDP